MAARQRSAENRVALCTRPDVDDLGNVRPFTRGHNIKDGTVKPDVQHKFVNLSSQKLTTPSPASVPQTLLDTACMKGQGVSLRDLRAEDKKRVADLIRELARLGEEKENAERNLKNERKHYQEQILSLVDRQEHIIQEYQAQKELLDHQTLLLQQQQPPQQQQQTLLLQQQQPPQQQQQTLLLQQQQPPQQQQLDPGATQSEASALMRGGQGDLVLSKVRVDKAHMARNGASGDVTRETEDKVADLSGKKENDHQTNSEARKDNWSTLALTSVSHPPGLESASTCLQRPFTASIDKELANQKPFTASIDKELANQRPFTAIIDKELANQRQSLAVMTKCQPCLPVSDSVVRDGSNFVFFGGSPVMAGSEPGNCPVVAGSQPGNCPVVPGSEPGNCPVVAGSQPGNCPFVPGSEPGSCVEHGKNDLVADVPSAKNHVILARFIEGQTESLASEADLHKVKVHVNGSTSVKPTQAESWVRTGSRVKKRKPPPASFGPLQAPIMSSTQKSSEFGDSLCINSTELVGCINSTELVGCINSTELVGCINSTELVGCIKQTRQPQGCLHVGRLEENLADTDSSCKQATIMQQVKKRRRRQQLKSDGQPQLARSARVLPNLHQHVQMSELELKCELLKQRGLLLEEQARLREMLADRDTHLQTGLKEEEEPNEQKLILGRQLYHGSRVDPKRERVQSQKDTFNWLARSHGAIPSSTSHGAITSSTSHGAIPSSMSHGAIPSSSQGNSCAGLILGQLDPKMRWEISKNSVQGHTHSQQVKDSCTTHQVKDTCTPDGTESSYDSEGVARQIKVILESDKKLSSFVSKHLAGSDGPSTDDGVARRLDYSLHSEKGVETMKVSTDGRSPFRSDKSAQVKNSISSRTCPDRRNVGTSVSFSHILRDETLSIADVIHTISEQASVSSWSLRCGSGQLDTGIARPKMTAGAHQGQPLFKDTLPKVSRAMGDNYVEQLCLTARGNVAPVLPERDSVLELFELRPTYRPRTAHRNVAHDDADMTYRPQTAHRNVAHDDADMTYRPQTAHRNVAHDDADMTYRPQTAHRNVAHDDADLQNCFTVASQGRFVSNNEVYVVDDETYVPTDDEGNIPTDDWVGASTNCDDSADVVIEAVSNFFRAEAVTPTERLKPPTHRSSFGVSGPCLSGPGLQAAVDPSNDVGHEEEDEILQEVFFVLS